MAKGTSFGKFWGDFWDDANKKITTEQRVVADLFFQGVKSQVINAIKESPVTQELENHTSPSQILNTQGSLFGFLGLIEGQKPVDEILSIVEQVMGYKLSRRLIKGGLKITIKVPDKKDFRTDDLILPWEGGYSVLDAVEKGLSGLGFYIAAKNIAYSRSGDGIQVKNKVRESEFRGMPWLSPIFKEVKDRAKQFR